MARLHEEYLAELFGGRKSRGSGSQWQDPADGRNNRLTEVEFAFAWDGKSTAGLGVTIDLKMIAKIREQAGGERPALGLRWYGTEDLQRVTEDWVAVQAADFAEMLAGARLAAEAENSLVEAGRLQAEARAVIAAHAPPQPGPDGWFPDSPSPGPVPLGTEFPQPAVSAGPAAPGLRGSYPAGRLPVPPHELWPCLVVDAQHDQDQEAGARITSKGYWIADDGTVSDSSVSTVRYDRGMGEMRLYVNEVRVLRGQLYVDGALRLTVGGPLS